MDGMVATVADPADIEAMLHWAYQTECVDRVSNGRMSDIGRMRSTLGGLGWRIALGVEVDCARGPILPVTCHPDAERIHERVLALGAERIGLVISHAKAGTRPDWGADIVPQLKPLIGGNGRPEVVRDTRGKACWCPVYPVADVEHIEFLRAVWLTWWGALDHLARDLVGYIDRPVRAPGVAREPWIAKRS